MKWKLIAGIVLVAMIGLIQYSVAAEFAHGKDFDTVTGRDVSWAEQVNGVRGIGQDADTPGHRPCITWREE